MKYFRILFLFIGLFTTGGLAYAHQPKLDKNTEIVVEDPEISKAYYKVLDSGPHTYTIQATENFELYVNILVPDLPEQPTDLSVLISREQEDPAELAMLEGKNYDRNTFLEPFGYDSYLMGPEFKESVPEGVYKIVVSSPENNRKYSLAIGEIEKFGWAETVESYASIPKIKRDFFNTSPISFIFSPLGYGLIIVMFLLSFIFGLVYRWLLKKIFPRTDRAVNRNIKLNGRRLRAACGVILFGIAITTSRSPWLLFASGFCFFEAIFSRCGLFAAIGRNDCPL